MNSDLFPGTIRPAYIEELRKDLRDTDDRRRKAGLPSYGPGQPNPAAKLFTIKTGQTWVESQKNVPAPRLLFGEFWREGELCLLFADTNMGKSILAVQIGNAISWGQPVGSAFCMNVHDAAVLYLDFELSAKQFELRYTDSHRQSLFSKRFYRAEFKPPLMGVPPDYRDMDEYLNAAINYALDQTGARVLIIDNISCLQHDTGYAAGALPLMQYLKQLLVQRNLSILVLAHTPKRRQHQPLSRNDLHGSKQLMNFADSAFAIGESQTLPGHRYLKQIKQRSGGETYGADNVCVCKLEHMGGYLRFERVAEFPEREHLSPRGAEHQVLTEQLKVLQEQRLSQRQMAARLHISLGLVNKLLNKEG